MGCINTNGTHNANHLIVIYRNGTEEDQDVVRWCSHCGAIVVDKDIDGKTFPGSVKKMQFPNTIILAKSI